jgi:hypothetical protein
MTFVRIVSLAISSFAVVCENIKYPSTMTVRLAARSDLIAGYIDQQKTAKGSKRLSIA